jgi:hypothetical protein
MLHRLERARDRHRWSLSIICTYLPALSTPLADGRIQKEMALSLVLLQF